jgi:hypothetical protein
MRKVILASLLTVAMAVPTTAHFPAGELLFAVQFPDANIPTIDGNHADWGVVPQVPYEVGNDKYSDSVYSKARGEIDVSDLSVRQIVGWNDNTNLLYFMAEVFDNVHTRDAEEPNAWWADDAWEVYVAPTHPEIDGGGGYAPGQDGIVKVGYNWSMPPTAGAWGGFNPPFDWVLDPDNNDAWSFAYTFSGEEFGESTYFYEAWIRPFDFVPDDGDRDAAEESDLEEGQIIAISWTFGDFDIPGGAALEDYQGFWSVSPNGCCRADNDMVLSELDDNIAWGDQATAVESNTWGRIKTEFNR